jgi:hypothetical protein
MTYKKGDRVTVNFGTSPTRAKELICSGEVRGYNEDTKEYTVKIDGGTVVFPKKEMMEGSLI